ncbi:hypothetical protein HK405_003496 [Cladochytrium tenue]|nr:hypothetical protein HK405_003496 [Cladochytrium tenue]
MPTAYQAFTSALSTTQVIHTIDKKTDLNPDDELVTRRVAELGQKQVLGRVHDRGIRLAPTEGFEVERLHDLKRRFQPGLASASDVPISQPTEDSDFAGIGRSSTPANQMAEDKPPSARHQRHEGDTRSEAWNRTSSEFWMRRATKYGYIRPKLLRIKALHEWLCKRARAASAMVPDQRAPYTFQIPNLCIEIPLGLFTEVIGQSTQCYELQEFMRSVDLSVPISKIPISLRVAMDMQFHRTKNCIAVALDVMQQLHLVQVTPSQDYNIERAVDIFQLIEVVPLHDCRKAAHPIMQTFNVYDANGFAEYWFQLEYIWLDFAVKNPKKKHVPRGLTPFQTTMSLHSNWCTAIRLPDEQKPILEHHADRKARWTPLGDNARLAIVVAEAQLSLPKVRQYYQKMEYDFQRHVMMWKERNLEKQRKELAADPGLVRTRSRRRRTGLGTDDPWQQAAQVKGRKRVKDLLAAPGTTCRIL